MPKSINLRQILDMVRSRINSELLDLFVYKRRRLIVAPEHSLCKIFVAKLAWTKEEVAIKDVSLTHTGENDEGNNGISVRERVKRELEIWKNASKQTQFVVELKNFHDLKSNVWFIMELCSFGDLVDFSKTFQREYGYLSMEIVKEILTGVFIGIKEIHKKGIIHRDLKPENIFLTENMIPKIGDFGSAFVVQMASCKKEKGEAINDFDFSYTPAYAPPEVFQRKPYNFTYDTFSLILLMFFVKYVEVAWRFPRMQLERSLDGMYRSWGKTLAKNPERLSDAESTLLMRSRLAKTKYAMTPDFPWTDSRNEFGQFARYMFRWDANTRPTIAEACEHPYMRDVIQRWEKNPGGASARLTQLVQDYSFDETAQEKKGIPWDDSSNDEESDNGEDNSDGNEAENDDNEEESFI